MSGGDPIVILGAGHCGGRAAEWLRRLGYDGPLVPLGAETEALADTGTNLKTLLKAA